jgi:hypothetical protein
VPGRLDGDAFAALEQLLEPVAPAPAWRHR